MIKRLTKDFDGLFYNLKISLFVYCIFYVSRLIEITTIGIDFPIINIFSKLVRYLCYLYFILAICFRVKKVDFKSINKYVQSMNKKQVALLIVTILTIIAIVLNMLLTGDRTLMMLIIILCYMSIYSIDFIIDVEATLQYISLLCVVTLCSLGLISNYIIFRPDGGVRYSVGFTYPTNLSQIIMFILLYWGYKKKFIFAFKEISLIQIFIVFMYMLTDSRTEFIVCEFIILFVLFKKIGIVKRLNKLFCACEKLFIHLFLLIPTVTLGIVYGYGYAFENLESKSLILVGFNKLNDLLSYRLYQTWYNFKFYGISLFGSNVDLIGNGIQSTKKFANVRSNFIDNEYMNILFSRGIIIFIMIMFLITITLFYLYKTKNHNLIFVSFIILMFGIMNPRIIDILYSVFMFIIAYAVKEILFGGKKDNGTV